MGPATSRFKIDGGKIVLEGIDLVTDGAVSHAVGEVDTARWPEQTYAVRSRIDFPRMKALFWARDRFTLDRHGRVRRHLPPVQGRARAVGPLRQPRDAPERLALRRAWKGRCVWTRDRFEVTKTRSGFYGGQLAIDFSMKPLGDPARPGIARLETAYEDVDVAGLMEARAFAGLRLDGRATGRNLLTWPLGRFREHTGDGEIRVAAATAAAGSDAAGADDAAPSTREARRCAPAFTSPPRVLNAKGFPITPRRRPPIFPLVFTTPIGGAIRYTYGPEWVTFAPGLDRDAVDLRRAAGPDRLRRSIGARLPRDQRRLAGERPVARRP